MHGVHSQPLRHQHRSVSRAWRSTRWPINVDTILMVICLSSRNRFSLFSHWWFSSKIAVKWLVKMPPHLAYVATLAYLVRRQAINDKLQGSAATYLRCGRIVKNQIKKGLLLSLPVQFLKSMNIWQSQKQEGSCLVHFLPLAIKLLLSRRKCTFLPVIMPNIYRF